MDPEIQDQSNSRADCPGHEGREGEREIITRKKMEWDFCSASTISIGRCFLASKWNGVELVFRELKGERAMQIRCHLWSPRSASALLVPTVKCQSALGKCK